MRIARRLFIVPLANDAHGKGTLINALLSQGLGTKSPRQKGVRHLKTPFGQTIDGYIFVRSYQEKEKKKYGNVVDALDGNDAYWGSRDLIIFPSHIDKAGTSDMVDAAHGAGFDAICLAVIVNDQDRQTYKDVFKLNWDERWTVNNPYCDDDDSAGHQCKALGHDLWTRISSTLMF